MSANENKIAPVLSHQDIESAIAVIDLAAEQGALKGWNNITAALQLRQKLGTFLEYVKANSPANVAGPVTETKTARKKARS